MGSPEACFRRLMVDYIVLSDDKFNAQNKDVLYSLRTKELEDRVRAASNSKTPCKNAFKAGMVFDGFLRTCGTDEANAAFGCLDEYLELFHCEPGPEDL